MPIYTFACDLCGTIVDEYHKIDECPEEFPCSCGDTKRKVIVVGHGGIFKTTPAWLDNTVRECLQDSDRVKAGLEAPLEDRNQYQRHLKEHGITEV